MRTKGAAIREHSTRVFSMGSRLTGWTAMIVLVRDSSSVSLVSLFRRHYLLLREASIGRFVLVQARVERIISLTSCRGWVTLWRSTLRCYDCGAFDHWSSECPR